MSLRFVEMTVGGFAGAEGPDFARGLEGAVVRVGRVGAGGGGGAVVTIR